MKDRLKSPVVWIAALLQIVLLIGLFSPNLSETIKVIGTIVIELATIFGFLNNPTNKTGF